MRYCVDGHEHDHPDANLCGDGQYPPFMVFDIEGQDWLPGVYITREAAQEEADRLNEGQNGQTAES